MSQKYGVLGVQTVNSTSDETMLSLVAASARIFSVYDFMFGVSGVHSDGTYIYSITNIISGGGGTGDAAVPQPLDLTKSIAAVTTGLKEITVEPGTVNAVNSFEIPTNTRASYRWQATPGSELVSATGAAAGFAFQSRSLAGTTATACTVLMEE